MAKTVLMVRVSTKKQDFTYQEKELREFALADGRENDFRIIESKESGRKRFYDEDNREVYRQGIREFYEYCENHDVEYVYFYDVDRITRRSVVTHNLMDFCINNHINLIVKRGNLRLLNDDGKVNYIAKSMIALLAEQAEQEMEIKFDRMRRTRNGNAEIGKASKIKPMYGYMVVNGHYAVNEAEAAVVRMIFSLCADGMTATKIGETISLETGETFSKERVKRLLRNTEYYGESQPSRKWGIVRRYPPIITEDEFRAARDSSGKRQSQPRTDGTVYFAQGLLRSTEGKLYCIRHGRNTYKRKDDDHNSMKEINCNYLDSLLWHVANHMQAAMDARDIQTAMNNAQASIDSNTALLNLIPSKEKKVRERLDKAALNNTMGYLSDALFHKAVKKLNNELDEISKERISLENAIAQQKKVLKSLNTQSGTAAKVRRILNNEISNNSLTDLEKKEIIERQIINVTAVKVSPKQSLITIEGALRTERYMYYSLREFKFYCINDDGSESLELVPILTK